jgi:hypothetical protein
MVRRFAFTAFLLLVANAAAAQSLQPTPTGPPPAVAPHPINAPAPADPMLLQKLELLRARIGQRDQLQREIDQLIIETQTPQQMVIHLELLEVNRTMAEKLGIGSKKRDPSVSVAEAQSWTMAELDELRRQGAVETLVSPKLHVTSGQLATSQIGVANANSELNGVESPFTDISVRADSLGNNQVRVDFRVDRTSPSEADKSNRDPALRTHCITVSSRTDSTFGETQVLGGMISKLTRTKRGALGRVTETVYVETVLLIRAEAVMPRTAGIVPAAAITLR